MKSLLISLMFISLATSVLAEESKKPEAVAVDNACTQEAQTAGCGNEKVGTGLLKCLKTYKKEHKDFKMTDGCKDSLKKLHEVKKANKESKK